MQDNSQTLSQCYFNRYTNRPEDIAAGFIEHV
jgi:hypothetical protein